MQKRLEGFKAEARPREKDYRRRAMMDSRLTARAWYPYFESATSAMRRRSSGMRHGDLEVVQGGERATGFSGTIGGDAND
jgi:hypothetical protein